jgi:hypothetical protein
MFLRRLALIAQIALFCSMTFSGLATAAQTAPAEMAAADPEMVKLVAREFGPDFTIDTSSPVIVGDFDGDGVEDMALVVAGKNPLTAAVEFGFKVIDPYNGFFGYGDPKVTMTFGTDTGKPRFVLVVHSWQASPAKAKFVIVNLPFDHIEITHTYLKVKKKKIMIAAISAQEAGGLTSRVYWDGKKYKWEVTGSME